MRRSRCRCAKRRKPDASIETKNARDSGRFFPRHLRELVPVIPAKTGAQLLLASSPRKRGHPSGRSATSHRTVFSAARATRRKRLCDAPRRTSSRFGFALTRRSRPSHRIGWSLANTPAPVGGARPPRPLATARCAGLWHATRQSKAGPRTHQAGERFVLPARQRCCSSSLPKQASRSATCSPS